MSSAPGMCDHLRAGPYPFTIEFVLDAYLGVADAVIRCNRCQRRYLINLIDWELPTLRERTFAVRGVDDKVFARFAHDVSRDYCDLTRKQAEADALIAASPLLDARIRLDVHDEVVRSVDARDPKTPTTPWRDRLL